MDVISMSGAVQFVDEALRKVTPIVGFDLLLQAGLFRRFPNYAEWIRAIQVTHSAAHRGVRIIRCGRAHDERNPT
jgi:hypothetical protein